MKYEVEVVPTLVRVRFRAWRKRRQYPHVNQVIRCHGILVRVTAVYDDRDTLDVRWYDERGLHEESASWRNCCLP